MPIDNGHYNKEAVENNFIKKFLFVDGTKSEDIIKAVGAANLEGMVGTAPGSEESVALKNFNDAYKAAYGTVPPLPFMTNVYDAVVVAALAAVDANAQWKRWPGGLPAAAAPECR